MKSGCYGSEKVLSQILLLARCAVIAAPNEIWSYNWESEQLHAIIFFFFNWNNIDSELGGEVQLYKQFYNYFFFLHLCLYSCQAFIN